MALINPYLHFNGNTEGAFTFYKSVFGWEFAKITDYKEISSLNFRYLKVMQIESAHCFTIGKSNVLMVIDV